MKESLSLGLDFIEHCTCQTLSKSYLFSKCLCGWFYFSFLSLILDHYNTFYRSVSNSKTSSVWGLLLEVLPEHTTVIH